MRRLFAMLPAWTPSWVLLPVLDRDYRRLVWWSYRLMVKVHLMSWAVAAMGPIATPWLTALLHQRAHTVSAEIQDLKRCIRERRGRLAMAAAAVQTTPVGNPRAR